MAVSAETRPDVTAVTHAMARRATTEAAMTRRAGTETRPGAAAEPALAVPAGAPAGTRVNRPTARIRAVAVPGTAAAATDTVSGAKPGTAADSMSAGRAVTGSTGGTTATGSAAARASATAATATATSATATSAAMGPEDFGLEVQRIRVDGDRGEAHGQSQSPSRQ
jgi:hypothetical protein